MRMIKFDFILYNEQANPVWTFSFECKDFLLLAKTGFSKSFIFQGISLPDIFAILSKPTQMCVLDKARFHSNY